MMIAASINQNKRFCVNKDPCLTPGAAERLGRDGYAFDWPQNRSFNPQVPTLTMQVVDIALLKYENAEPYQQEPCIYFQNGMSRSLVNKNDSALVSNLSRYRLQLSDGTHIVAAKFYPEHVEPSKGKVKHVDNIHDLVVNGNIRKGTILSFKPNNHVESGEGIASILEFQVEGWSEIIGEPQPCHSGVTAFSPSNVHHCTVPLTYSQLEPLPRPILLLAKLIEKHCGFCAIAGSAPLAYYLENLPGCAHCYGSRYSPGAAKICENAHSNDVDLLFVPQYPEGLAHFKQTGGQKLGKHGRIFFDSRSKQEKVGYLHDALEDLHKEHGFRHTKIECTNIKLSAVEEGGTDYGWMRVFVGLKQKIEFQLVSSTGEVLEKPFQILVMNTFTSSPGQSWSDRVTDDFDVDVVKAVAQVDDAARVESIAFAESAMSNMLSGKFNYVMRPCHSFKQMWKRLKKSKTRAFELASFGFDRRVTPEWKEHILNEFKIMCAREWVKEWGEASGVIIPEHVVTKHIVPFLKGTPEYRYSEEQRIHKRDMLRGMVRRELERNDWHDPGQEKVCRFAAGFDDPDPEDAYDPDPEDDEYYPA